MLPTVSSTRSVHLLRASSDQIRRAAQILAQLTEDTADGLADRLPVTEAGGIGADANGETELQNTILKAQRSFAAGLRMAQLGEREGAR